MDSSTTSSSSSSCLSKVCPCFFASSSSSSSPPKSTSESGLDSESKVNHSPLHSSSSLSNIQEAIDEWQKEYVLLENIKKDLLNLFSKNKNDLNLLNNFFMIIKKNKNFLINNSNDDNLTVDFLIQNNLLESEIDAEFYQENSFIFNNYLTTMKKMEKKKKKLKIKSNQKKLKKDEDENKGDDNENKFLFEDDEDDDEDYHEDEKENDLKTSFYYSSNSSTKKNSNNNSLSTFSPASSPLSSSSSLISRLMERSWTTRRNQIDFTQGKLHATPVKEDAEAALAASPPSSPNPSSAPPSASSSSSDSSVSNSLSLKSIWPSSLPDLTFEVIKINKYNQHFPRTLVLTQHYLINYDKKKREKNTNFGEGATQEIKLYKYNEIKLLLLINDQYKNKIKIIYKNNKKNIFLSSISSYIINQIILRIQLRQLLDKKIERNLLIDDEEDYDEEKTREEKDRKEEKDKENKIDNSFLLFHSDIFGESISQEALKISSSSSPTSSSSSSYIPNKILLDALHSEISLQSEKIIEKFSLALALRVIPQELLPNPETFRSSDLSTRHTSARFSSNFSTSNSSSLSTTSSLFIFPTNSPEWVLQQSILVILNDTTTSEGNTLKKFIDEITQSSNDLIEKKKMMISKSIKNSIQSSQASSNYDRDNIEIDQKEVEELEDEEEENLSVTSLLTRIRHFIEGLHEFVLTQRGFALGMIYEQEKQKWLINKQKSSSSSCSSSSSNSFSSLAPPSLSVSNSSASISSQTSASSTSASFILSRENLLFLKNNDMEVSKLNDEIILIISFLIYFIIEELIFISLKSTITKLLNFENSFYPEEEILNRKLQHLKGRDQISWGIPPHLASPTKYIHAINELSALELSLSPTQQLFTLIRAIKSIYSECKYIIMPHYLQQQQLASPSTATSPSLSTSTSPSLSTSSPLSSPSPTLSSPLPSSLTEPEDIPSSETMDRGQTEDEKKEEESRIQSLTEKKLLNQKLTEKFAINADDLVPIFLYILAQTPSLKNAFFLRDVLWNLCHPDLLQGEGGYILTVFESALAYLLEDTVENKVIEETEEKKKSKKNKNNKKNDEIDSFIPKNEKKEKRNSIFNILQPNFNDDNDEKALVRQSFH